MHRGQSLPKSCLTRINKLLNPPCYGRIIQVKIMSINFSCPVCGRVLNEDGRTLRCENNHCFDMAKQGYVNLLQSQKSSKKRHGDDSLMVRARQDFLEKGYYGNLRDAVVNAVADNTQKNAVIADLGCGECWYTEMVYGTLENATVFGIDISKQALIAGSKRCKALKLAVASTADVPLPDESCDAVISIFAPYSEAEVLRILRRGGVFVKAFPLEEHLIELKSVIYSKPYKNEVSITFDEGFEKVSLDYVKSEITLSSNEDIMNLFKMTPYYYKTGQADQQKLEALSSLKTKTEFGVIVLKKI